MDFLRDGGNQHHQQRLARPYRSKRQRPCDVCRRRKHGCFFPGQPGEPCVICRKLRVECTFNDAPKKRNPNSAAHPSQSSDSTGSVTALVSNQQQPGTHPSAPTNETPSDSGSNTFQDRLPGESASYAFGVDRPRGGPHDTMSNHDGMLLATDTDLMVPVPSQLDFWHVAPSLLDPNFGLLPPLSVDDITALNESDRLSHQRPAQDYLDGQADLFPGQNLSLAAGQGMHINDPDPELRVRLPSNAANAAAADSVSSSQGLPPNQQQTARPLDDLGPDRGSRDQYSLLSGEMDPYLLQRMRFSNDATCDFGRFAYRSLTPARVASKARRGSGLSPARPALLQNQHRQQPIQFVKYKPLASVGESTKDAARSAALDKLVPFDTGSRLVGLFLRYVFPSLPAVSRTLLKVRPETLIPPVSVLRELPAYLLAAIYGTAEPFRRYDPLLCISLVDTEFPTTEIWDLVRQGILEELHSPNLQLIQAILIYIQRSLGDATSPTTDNAGDWPLLGAAVNMATQLGLHLDCRAWSLPPHEKRLRRRLWWIIVSETSWRTLLQGRPGYLQEDDWDVTPLDEVDFCIDGYVPDGGDTSRHVPTVPGPCPYCHFGHDFVFLASLSTIIHDIHTSFYTARALSRLSGDFAAATRAARMLLSRLDEWKSRLPRQLRPESVSDADRRPYFHSASGAHLKLAFLTAEILIYRAIWRPLDDVTASGAATAQSNEAAVNNVGMDTRRHAESPMEENECAPGSDATARYVESGDLSSIIRGSIDLAKRSLSFTQQMSSYDRNSFAYYWASSCFATMSNYILLLLVQAPTAQAASDMMTILVRWVITLRDQSVTFAFMRLGLLRLDSILGVGLENSFVVSDHVKQALQEG